MKCAFDHGLDFGNPAQKIEKHLTGRTTLACMVEPQGSSQSTKLVARDFWSKSMGCVKRPASFDRVSFDAEMWSDHGLVGRNHPILL
jgi:hypothetical protein